MKVLYILHSTIMGGATLVFLSMLKELKEKGVTPVLVVPNDMDDVFFKRVQQLQLKVYECPIALSVYPFRKGDFRWKRFITYIREVHGLLVLKKKSLNAIQNIVDIERPDIIHTNVGVVHEGFYCAKNNGIPHIWHIREYQIKDFRWKPFPSLRNFVNKLKKSYVVTITKDLSREFCVEGLPETKVVYDGVLHKNDIYLDFPKKKYFLCASRISPEKNLEEVITAFSEFHKINEEYNLVILGFGPEEYVDSLRKMSFDLGCGNFIVFKGYVENVTDYMRKATALIVASRFEGFGLMTAEAMFTGCLVIGRNTGGTKELIEEANGLSFCNGKELLAYLLEVATMSAEEYIAIVKRAQKIAVQLFSIERNADDVYSLYQKVLS